MDGIAEITVFPCVITADMRALDRALSGDLQKSRGGKTDGVLETDIQRELDILQQLENPTVHGADRAAGGANM